MLYEVITLQEFDVQRGAVAHGEIDEALLRERSIIGAMTAQGISAALAGAFLQRNNFV